MNGSINEWLNASMNGKIKEGMNGSVMSESMTLKGAWPHFTLSIYLSNYLTNSYWISRCKQYRRSNEWIDASIKWEVMNGPVDANINGEAMNE